jgi:signal transduction histidine kinase
MRMTVTEVDLNTLARDAIDAVRFSAVNKGIALVSTLPADIPAVLGDADRLKQVIWNLVVNAIKFTPSGGRIEVVLSTSGATIRLEVHDTGAGIAPDFLPHVFERFRQADVSKERSGLGLGLAIARHLVELHGGSIQAESTGLGHGASFVVTLPAVGATDAPEGVRLE